MNYPKPKAYWLTLLLITFLFCGRSEAWYGERPLPKSLQLARDEYMDSQLPQDLKNSLAAIKKGLIAAAKLNSATAQLWGALPSHKEMTERVVAGFQKASDIAKDYIFGFDDNVFSDVCDALGVLERSSSGALKAAGKTLPFVGEAVSLIQMIDTFSAIRDAIKDDYKAWEAATGYELTFMEFNRSHNNSVWGILEGVAKEFEDAANNLTRPDKIKDLREFLDEYSGFFESLSHDVEWNFHPTSPDNWYSATIKRVSEATLKQLSFNTNFSSEISKALAKMPASIAPRMPDFKVASISVVPPAGKTEEDLNLKDEVKVKAEIKNNGQLATEPSAVRFDAPGKSFVVDLAPLAGDETRSVEWAYTLNGVSTTFKVTANYESKAWETDSSPGDNEKSLTFTLKPRPDFKMEFISIPVSLYTGKESNITVRIINGGTLSARPERIALWVDNGLVEEKWLDQNIERGKYADLIFKWTPKEKGSSILACKAYLGRDQRDFDVSNNEAKTEVKVLAKDYAWELIKDSLKLNTDNPKIGEQVGIYFNVANQGEKEDAVAKVFVDGELIKAIRLNVPSGKEISVGMGASEPIPWQVLGGSHLFKVTLEADNISMGSIEKTISVGTLMPGVTGVDLVLEAVSAGGQAPNATIKIYNRGSQVAKGVMLDIIEYHSGVKEPVVKLSKNLGDVRSHEQKVLVVDGLCNNCQVDVLVDKNNGIKEFDENNTKAKLHFGTYLLYEPPRNIRTEGPDLIVANVVNLDRPLEVGETRAITIVVGNPNQVEAKKVKVDYEFWNLALNDITPSHGYLKGSKILPSVPAEGDGSFVVDYKAVYPADYKLTIQVDPDTTVPETDEYNNKLEKYFSVGGEVTSQIYFSGKDVDLAIDKEVKVSNKKPNANLPVTFEVRVRNNSAINVWGADLDMFINDKLEAGEPLGDFAANSEKTFTFTHTFTASGDYNVKFMADAKNAVPEKDEGNNIASVTIEVAAGIFGTGHRDASVASFSLSKTTCLQGEPVTASAVIKNTGSDPLRALLCTIGPHDFKPFYVKIIPILDPGKEIKVSTTLPALIAGEH
ncbi:MAG: CARDB domain-containing protein, partial [Candidatus Omnitrophota bacterium]|nr:CARDB domain-containing protein [Candidatus Omnitrophota bacterium]